MGIIAQYMWSLYYPQTRESSCECWHFQPFTTLTNIQPTGDTISLFECLQVSLLSVSYIHHWTDRDPVLAKVRTFVWQGWPSHLAGEEFQPFVHRRQELPVCNNVLWSSRVIVPPKVRESVFKVLHSTHPRECLSRLLVLIISPFPVRLDFLYLFMSRFIMTIKVLCQSCSSLLGYAILWPGVDCLMFVETVGSVSQSFKTCALLSIWVIDSCC